MTREEARKRLRGILTEAVEFENSVCYVTEEDREPLEMAIKALEQEPKTGHWKKMVEVYDLQQNRMLVPYGYDDAKLGNTPVYVCDCGCESNKNSKFCPDCGAKMSEIPTDCSNSDSCENCKYDDGECCRLIYEAKMIDPQERNCDPQERSE